MNIQILSILPSFLYKIMTIYALCLWIPIVNASQIQLLTEELAPWQMKYDQELVGISVEIVQEIQKRIGNDKKIKVFPWNRAYNMTLKKEGFALFSTARSVDREGDFKWVGPLVPLKFVMYKNKNDTKIYKKLSDAKSVAAIAVTKNDVSEQFLRQQGFKNLQVDIGHSGQENIQRVFNGEAQLFSSGYISGHYQIKTLHLSDKIVMTQIPTLFESSLNIAFNINTPNKTINTWQKILEEIKSDGTYDRIIEKYRK